MWGKRERNLKCQQCIFDYINIIKEYVKEGIQTGELREGNAETIATSIFGVICSSLTYKLKAEKEIMVDETCDDFFDTILNGIKK